MLSSKSHRHKLVKLFAEPTYLISKHRLFIILNYLIWHFISKVWCIGDWKVLREVGEGKEHSYERVARGILEVME